MSGSVAALRALRTQCLEAAERFSDYNFRTYFVKHTADTFDAVEAKGGDEERVVMLSLVGHPKPNDCIPTQWTGMMGAEIATRILQFTSIFPYGYVGDVCSDDYAPFFAEATDHIDTVCSIPAG